MHYTVLQPELTQSSIHSLQNQITRHKSPLVVLPPNVDTAPYLDRIDKAAKLGSLPDVILTTSGSRSLRPHLVGLSWNALIASASRTNKITGTGRWWLNLPPHHIAGFQVVFRSHLAGITPTFDCGEATITALVPTQLRRFSDADLAHFETILIGGAQIDKEDRNRRLPLITTYGMTETCGGCVYDGLPLPDVEVRINEGVVEIAGPTLMNGYLDEPSPFTSDGWLRTNDLGQIKKGQLTILGRTDDVIISGGENVSANNVAQIIRSAFPELEVEVVGLPDPVWGQIVCAVITGDPTHFAPKIVEAVQENAPRWAAPRKIVHLDAVPLLANGKVDHQRLQNLAATSVSAWERPARFGSNKSAGVN